MVYTKCLINGKPVLGFIDCGADQCYLSTETARRLDLSNFVNEMFDGIAYGAGSARIIGTVHKGTIFPVAFSEMQVSSSNSS